MFSCLTFSSPVKVSLLTWVTGGGEVIQALSGEGRGTSALLTNRYYSRLANTKNAVHIKIPVTAKERSHCCDS